LRALAGPASGDAVAGEILEMLGFDHIDVAARIVNARVVRIPHELLSLQHVLMCPVRCVECFFCFFFLNRSVRFQRQSRVQTCSLASLQGVLDSLKKAVEMMRAADAANTGEDKSNVSVTVKLSTASQKAIEKMERKAARKAKSKGSGGAQGMIADVEYACSVGWAAVQVCTSLAFALCLFCTMCQNPA
jgi:hypothetical protein